MHDHIIIELIRTNRTDKALAALYRHFPMIRTLIRSKGGTAEDAEDIFQEALIILPEDRPTRLTGWYNVGRAVLASTLDRNTLDFNRFGNG